MHDVYRMVEGGLGKLGKLKDWEKMVVLAAFPPPAEMDGNVHSYTNIWETHSHHQTFLEKQPYQLPKK